MGYLKKSPCLIKGRLLIPLQWKKLALHRHWCLYARMSLVIFQFKIFEFEIKNIFYGRVYFHSGQWKRRSAQLKVGLLKMIVVKVNIAERMNEIARFHIAYLGNHEGKQRVGSNIKWHTQKHICRALVQLTA